MNKQEVIEMLESKAVNYYNETSGWTKEIELDIAIDIITQLDEPVKPPEPEPWEPEKPIVPEYIQTWIQGAQYNGCDLYEAMNNWEVPTKTDYWIQSNPETFAKAWLFGYEVEKEKLYIVELPNPNGDSNRYGLCKVDGRIIIGSFVFGLNKASNAKLTEAEIKKDFDWAWQFAEEVEE